MRPLQISEPRAAIGARGTPHRYRVFGLRIASNVSLPGLVPAPANESADVTVELAPRGPWWREHTRDLGDVWRIHPVADEGGRPVVQVRRRTRDGRFHLRYADGTEFTIDPRRQRIWGCWPEHFTLADAATYASKSAMPTARGSPAAAVVGSEIYVAGGDPGGSDFAVYDPATDTWQPLPPMPTARQHLGAAGVAGRFYAVSGRSSLGAGQDNVDANEVYDPATGIWTSLAPLPRARSGLAVAAADRFVLAFGGEGNAESPDGTFPDADAYDTVLASWTTLSPMPTPRHGIGAANLGGRIHIPAGGPVEGFGLTDVHEVYDPSVELPTVSLLPATSPLGLFALTLGFLAGWCWLVVPRGLAVLAADVRDGRRTAARATTGL